MLILKKGMVAVFLCTMAFGVAAEEPGFTLGLKTGIISIDEESSGDDGSGKGINLGYTFGVAAIELELLRGEFDFRGGKADVNTAAIYGTFRSAGAGYFLGKFGYLIKKDIEFPGFSRSKSGPRIGLGVGGGYRFNDVFGLEAEFTMIDVHVSYIGLAARLVL